MIAFGFYLLMIVSYFLHSTSRFPWLGDIRFDMVMVGVVLATSFLEKSPAADRTNHTSKYLWAIIAYVVLSLPFVMWPGSVLRAGAPEYLKVVVFYFFTVAIVNTEWRMKTFIYVFLACQIFRFVEPAYLHLTTGYWGSGAFSFYEGKLLLLRRLSGAPNDIINPNQLAWVIVTTVPFLYYLGVHGKLHLKILSAAVAPVAIYALMLTGSRSGLICLMITVITILFYGQKKFRRVAIGLVILVPVAFLVADNLSPDLSTRYLSTFQGGLPGSETAAGRFRGLKEGLSTLGARILIGHGLGTSLETNANLLAGRALKTHNLYLETTQELGLIGLTLFLLFVRGIWFNLRDAKSILTDSPRGSPWLASLTKALQVWVIMDVIYSISCFGLTSWEWYLFGGISVAILRVARKPEKGREKVYVPEEDRVLAPVPS